MLIGISGRARCGKNTAGEFLEQARDFKQTAFAYSLKEAAKIIFGWTDDHVHGYLKEVEDKFWGMSPRKALQLFGTDACRNNIDKDIWVKSLHKRILDDIDSDWVITDVRFPNECKFIQDLGGFVLRIDRNNPDEIAGEATQHQSETSMDNWKGWDHIIENNGSISELYAKVDDCIERLRMIIR